MRAHSLRRLLWLSNVALGAAVLGVVAWYATKVRPAVAAPERVQPPWADAALKDYQDRPPVQSTLPVAVTEEELKEIDRPEFRTAQGRRYHWLYSGQLPPPPPEEPREGPATPPPPQGLETLGRVFTLFYVPPPPGAQHSVETVVLWRFTSNAVVPFVPGEFVREDKTRPERFKLVDVKALGGRRYRIEYDVYDDPAGEPVKRSFLEYDANVALDPAIGGRIVQTGEAPAASGDGTAGDGTAGTGAATPGVTAPGASDEPVTAPGTTDVTVEDIHPEVVQESASSVRVNFDERTWEYLRGANAESVAGTVKTQPARDQNGQLLGLQVTGFTPDSPATKFDIRPMDIIVSIDGKPVRSRSDAVNVAQAINPESRSVQVVIDRNGRRITYTVDPGDPATRRAVSTRVGRALREEGGN